MHQTATQRISHPPPTILVLKNTGPSFGPRDTYFVSRIAPPATSRLIQPIPKKAWRRLEGLKYTVTKHFQLIVNSGRNTTYVFQFSSVAKHASGRLRVEFFAQRRPRSSRCCFVFFFQYNQSWTTLTSIVLNQMTIVVFKCCVS